MENIYIQLLKEINDLKNEISELKTKNFELNDHLKKYTAHRGAKVYYQKNKEIILEKNKEYVKLYKQQLSPEKIKQYNKTAYENRKNKNNKV